jgi:hypothetical protein
MSELQALKQQNAELLLKLGQAQEALQFYAEGRHLVKPDSRAGDAASAVSNNFQLGEAGTAAVEDGSTAKLALEKLQQAAPDKNHCPDCGQHWEEHDFGVPRPYCP